MHNFTLPKHTGIKVFLLAIFFGYYTNIALFTHVHLLGSEVVVHAHPFIRTAAATGEGKTTPPSHSHNSLELQLLSDLSNFATDGAAEIPSLEIFIPSTPVTHPLTVTCLIPATTCGHPPLRAPPAV